MDLSQASLLELRDAVRARKVSAHEVSTHFLERIQRLNSNLNAFVTVNPKALEEAEAVDQAISDGSDPGPLAGVPVAIKDLLCTEGLRTTAGSRALENFTPPYSATVVNRLRKAGAIVIGKTNLDEFGMGSSNENSHFGEARNPWDLERVPGGSSGGSAAAVAAGLAPLAIGTDTGGSIRQPSSFCGIYGIKPTYGRVSRYGIIAFASSLDQAGPMANSTADCAAALEVISGWDRHDATTAAEKPFEMLQLPSETPLGLKGLRIGIPQEYFSAAVDPDVSRVTQAALKTLAAQGAEVIDLSLPSLRHTVAVYYLVATSEASSNLARYDGIRYGHRASSHNTPPADLADFYSRNRGEAFGSEVKRRIMLGTYALSSGFYDAYYLKASQVRRLIQNDFIAAFSKCDVILSPVAASPAFKIGERIADPLQMYLNDIFTTAANLAGLPAMSVPAGFSSTGLPIGVQLMAKPFDERSLFSVSWALEKCHPREQRRPSVI